MLAKICGLKTLEDAQHAVKNNADFLGIILVPNRARTIDFSEAQKISEFLRSLPSPRPKLVGVFRNQTIEEIKELAENIPLDIVQLHGSEPDSFLTNLNHTIIRRLVPGTPDFVDQMLRISQMPNKYALIDSENGGDGKLVDWEQLNEVADLGGKFIIAGGLTAENVHLAMNQRGCIGVDVSGGVETDGVKDHAKITDFLVNVKKAT